MFATKAKAESGRIAARCEWESLGDMPERVARQAVRRVSYGGLRLGKRRAAIEGRQWTQPAPTKPGDLEERAARCVASAYGRWVDWRTENQPADPQEVQAKVAALIVSAASGAVFNARSVEPTETDSGVVFDLMPQAADSGQDYGDRLIRFLLRLPEDLASLALLLATREPTERDAAEILGMAKTTLRRRRVDIKRHPAFLDLVVAMMIESAIGD